MAAEEALRAGRSEWVGLGVLALACVVYAMDLTVLHLAVGRLNVLPEAEPDLRGFSPACR